MTKKMKYFSCDEKVLQDIKSIHYESGVLESKLIEIAIAEFCSNWRRKKFSKDNQRLSEEEKEA